MVLRRKGLGGIAEGALDPLFVVGSLFHLGHMTLNHAVSTDGMRTGPTGYGSSLLVVGIGRKIGGLTTSTQAFLPQGTILVQRRKGRRAFGQACLIVGWEYSEILEAADGI